VSRRTKIVCTIGPATASPDRIKELVQAGMDVARLNFSHGDRDDHKRVYDMIRDAADARGTPSASSRTCRARRSGWAGSRPGRVEWRTGEEVRITVEDVAGTHDRSPPPTRAWPTTRARTTGCWSTTARSACGSSPSRARRGLPGHRGRPGQRQQGPVAARDERLGAGDVARRTAPTWSSRSACGWTSIALSFVRSPADIDQVHKIMDEHGARLPVVAKLEKPEAVDNLEAIVLAFDGIMVARGDLGVELPLEHVPLVQKRAIQIARENAKPVIVATQMLESMITNSRPTRAEASTWPTRCWTAPTR
jgi:pyruvate kinase